MFSKINDQVMTLNTCTLKKKGVTTFYHKTCYNCISCERI